MIPADDAAPAMNATAPAAFPIQVEQHELTWADNAAPVTEVRTWQNFRDEQHREERLRQATDTLAASSISGDEEINHLKAEVQRMKERLAKLDKHEDKDELKPLTTKELQLSFVSMHFFVAFLSLAKIS